MGGAVPNWKTGGTIPLGRRTLRVVAIRDDDADQPPVVIVEFRVDSVSALDFPDFGGLASRLTRSTAVARCRALDERPTR